MHVKSEISRLHDIARSSLQRARADRDAYMDMANEQEAVLLLTALIEALEKHSDNLLLIMDKHLSGDLGLLP